MNRRRSKRSPEKKAKATGLSFSGDLVPTVKNGEWIKERIVALHPPESIEHFDVQFGEDSEGEPAVWINFYVEDDSEATISAVTTFAKRVQQDLLSHEWRQGWPYIRVRSA